MATHSIILAWRIPCTEEPGGLQSMVSQRVGCDCVTTTTFYAKHTLFTSVCLADPLCIYSLWNLRCQSYYCTHNPVPYNCSVEKTVSKFCHSVL